MSRDAPVDVMAENNGVSRGVKFNACQGFMEIASGVRATRAEMLMKCKFVAISSTMFSCGTSVITRHCTRQHLQMPDYKLYFVLMCLYEWYLRGMKGSRHSPYLCFG